MRTYVVVLVLFLMTGCLGRSEDLTTSSEFAPLVGLCLECKEVMVAAPSGNDVFSLIPLAAVPNRIEIGTDYLEVPKGSRVLIDEIRFVSSFDGSYLFIRGDLSLMSGPTIRTNLRAIFDREWVVHSILALDDGETIDLDPEDLPIYWGYVSHCE